MQTTVLKEVIAFLFGRKYYANIVATKGTDRPAMRALNVRGITKRLNGSKVL